MNRFYRVKNLKGAENCVIHKCVEPPWSYAPGKGPHSAWPVPCSLQFFALV